MRILPNLLSEIFPKNQDILILKLLILMELTVILLIFFAEFGEYVTWNSPNSYNSLKKKMVDALNLFSES